MDFTLSQQSAIIITVTYNSGCYYKGGDNMEVSEMSKEELMKISVEEFSRLQDWMLSTKDKDSVTYNSMYKRYVELKVILSSLGVNITELNKIKE